MSDTTAKGSGKSSEENPPEAREPLQAFTLPDGLLQFLHELSVGIQRISLSVAKFLSRDDVAAFLAALPENLARLEIAIGRIQRLPKDMHAAFLAAGFPPGPRLTTSDLAEIQQEHESGNVESIVALIEERYAFLISNAQARDEMTKDWEENPLLSRRIHILREALVAASMGLYSIAVPSLLAQLEGIIADGAPHSGQMYLTAYKNHVEVLASSEMLFGDLLRDYVSSVLLVQFAHGAPLNSELSRHAILHGADVGYGTRLNAIKIVMLVDYVQSVYAENAKKNQNAT